MASIVNAGTGNWSYANSTGGNVRVIISFFYNNTASQNNNAGLTQTIAGVSVASATSGTNASFVGFGKHVTWRSTNNSYGYSRKGIVGNTSNGGFIDEFWLADGQSASVSGTNGSYAPKGYNIVIIPEGN
tara:strand:+ start:131 stop:520 length:390 start_codon:yes stop_codon:yes gene_type:complete